MEKVKFTAPVRRGLCHMRSLLIESFSTSEPPNAEVKIWPKVKQTEFNRAMKWLEWIEHSEKQTAWWKAGGYANGDPPTNRTDGRIGGTHDEGR